MNYNRGFLVSFHSYRLQNFISTLVMNRMLASSGRRTNTPKTIIKIGQKSVCKNTKAFESSGDVESM